MKTKIKRHSRAVISVILAISMLISCMMVGLIATDAAKVTGNEELGATTNRYLWYDMTGNNGQLSALTNKVTLSSTDDNYYTGSFASTGSNLHFIINNSATTHTSSLLNSSTTVTYKGDVADWTRIYENSGSYGVEGQLNSGNTYYIGYNVSANTVIVGSSQSDIDGGGSGGSTEPTTEETTSAPGETWIVAGSNIFGSSWTPSDENNTMSYDGSMYYWEKTGVTHADKFEFKITKDNGWDGAVPSSNFVVNYGDSNDPRTVSKSGDKLYWGSGDTIIIAFDGNDRITVSSEPAQTKHDVSVSAGAGGTVSPSGTVRVGEVTPKAITATASAGYRFSSWTNGSGITQVTDTADGDNQTQTITTKSTGDYTVQANFTKKPVYKVTAKANNSDYGSATASVGAAYQGQTVTVTYAENTGTYNNYTVVDSESATVASSISGNTITFTMPANPVTVTVNFDEYTGTSDYYYNGYDKDSFAQISGKYAQRMSKGKINGVEYSYYHVQNRTEVDQTFTVSYGDLDYDRSASKYMYWTRPSSDPTTHSPAWSNNGNQYAMFYSNDSQVIQDWTNMEGVGTTDGGYKFKTKIPDGARYARVKDQYNSNQTVLINLNTETNGGNNGFYISGHDGTDYTVTGWKEEGTSVIGDVFEYFKGSGNYTADFDTAGFNNHNINIKVNNISVTHSVAKPNGLSEAYRNDYYILVFHPNTTYNYNGVEDTTSTNPIILWSPTKPGETNNDATVYAKDGTLRNNSTSNNITSVYESYALHATTTINVGDSSVGTRHDDKYTVYTQEKDNTQITVTTTIEEGDWRNNYYVKGFSVNGVTPALYEYKSDGTYSVTLTLGEDKILYDGGEIDYVNGKYVEITPIYYAKTPGDTVTFYVRGFDEEVASSWGNTVAAYPFYNSTYAGDNALGGYPGQPMVNYGGKLFIDVPLKASNNQSIQGITLNNYYWDRIHGTTDNEGNFQHIRAVSTHAQTYDFDDFSKIYYENIGDEPDFIYFDFKYVTEKNNEKSDTKSADSSYNTFEDLVDAQGQKTDIFGTVLEGADLDKAPIYVVSDGYFNTFAGAYATQWHVYQNNGAFIETIAPSIRWVKDVENLNTTKYPYTSTKYKDGQYYPITDYTDEYTALQAYVNTPVKISYDMEIRNEAGQTGWDTPSDTKHNSNADDKAKRSDGIWMYSYTGVKINANTKVEISTDDGKTYSEDPYISGNKTANDLAAYFTNEEFNGETSVTTRSSASDKFTFNAESAGEFIFVGWYLLDNGKYFPISKNTAASSDMDSGATFVARFIENPSGTLTLSHSVLKEASYMGDADTYIGIEVVDTSNNNNVIYRVVDTDKKSEITLNNTYVKYNHGYTVNVKLYTTPKLDDTFARYQTGAMDTSVFFNYRTTAETPTKISEFSFNIDDLFEYDSENTQYVQNTKALRYYSQLNKIEYKYSITYAYTSYLSLHGTQRYVVEGTFSESDISNYLEKSDSVYDEYTKVNVTAYAFKNADSKAAFINKYGPYENNFMIDLEWNTGAVTPRYNSENRTYTIDVNPTPHEDYYVDLKFILPYAHTSRSSGFEPTSLVYDRTQDDEPIPELNYKSWWAWNGVKKYGTDKGDPKFVTAPATLTDGDDTLYFRYWSVKTVPNDSNYSSVEYTKCYSREFNFAIFQDTIVEPIYTKLTDKEIADRYIPTPHAEAIKDENANGATITFIENSRNQYNNHECGDNMKESRQKQGDRIYTDFLLSFANTNDTMYQTYSNGTYTAGLLIERVDTLGVNKYGDYETKTDSEYKTMYDSQLTPAKINEIKTFLSGSSSSQKDGTGVLYQRSEFDANKLDNKNRIQYYYSISTRNHSGDFVDNGNKNYVYRAYSYIKNAQGTVELLSTPIYFTIYDMASITNAAEGLSYDGL